jgi:DNA-binding MarR family transcriptional regulator
MRRRPPPQLIQDLVHLLEEIHRFLRPGALPEITARQLNLLALLNVERPTRPSELAIMRHVSRSAISHALRRLERAGLIRRCRDPNDRRFVQVRLTARGESLKNWPALVEPERVAEIIWRLPSFRRGATRRSLTMIALAARGRDFWRERIVTGIYARASPA